MVHSRGVVSRSNGDPRLYQKSALKTPVLEQRQREKKRNIHGSPVAVEIRRFFECATLNTSQKRFTQQVLKASILGRGFPIHGRQKLAKSPGVGVGLRSWEIGCRYPWQAQLTVVQVRKREREDKKTTHRRTNCKENVTGATYCVLSQCDRLKRSLGDNKKTNPVREVCGREKSLWQ